MVGADEDAPTDEPESETGADDAEPELPASDWPTLVTVDDAVESVEFGEELLATVFVSPKVLLAVSGVVVPEIPAFDSSPGDVLLDTIVSVGVTTNGLEMSSGLDVATTSIMF